jgi:hypothetical protein
LTHSRTKGVIPMPIANVPKPANNFGPDILSGGRKTAARASQHKTLEYAKTGPGLSIVALAEEEGDSVKAEYEVLK